MQMGVIDGAKLDLNVYVLNKKQRLCSPGK